MAEPAPAFDRLLPLEGGFNLRDMGGYPTADGGHVLPGMLYRSGTMALLTDDDAQHLRDLGIRTICDLRRGNERRKEPTRWHEPSGADVHYIARDYDETSGLMEAMLRSGVATVEEMHAAMVRLYRRIPADHAPSYRLMFDRLLGGHVPLLFNCSAGKDRTGVAAVLVLHALGVGREAILDDYLATGRYADFSRLLERRDSILYAYARRAPELMAPVLAVEPAYFESLMEAFDADYGGIDAYLATIGVDEGAKQRLRELLVER